MYTDVYVDGMSSSKDVTMLSIMNMRGSLAKKYMTGLDFEKVWMTCKNGSPVLRCFNNAAEYSCKRDPSTVEISFATLGGEECKPVRGIPGYTKITEGFLPVPKFYGYEFKGWHHYDSYGAPFELDVFPNYDIFLYAQWEEVGFLVDFEDKIDTQYDINSGVEVYKPGVAKYNPKYLHGGYRALHTLADSEVAPTFLLTYANRLEVGMEYEMTMHITSDSNVKSGKIELIHTNYPDVNDEKLGRQSGFELSDIKIGEWKEYKFIFTANTPYLLIEAPKGCSLYFDDIHLVPTGVKGELGNIITFEPEPQENMTGANTSKLILPIIIVCCVSLAVVIILATVIILIVRRKKAK
jgi:hypothetical protein